jgi:hypothetical protein
VYCRREWLGLNTSNDTVPFFLLLKEVGQQIVQLRAALGVERSDNAQLKQQVLASPSDVQNNYYFLVMFKTTALFCSKRAYAGVRLRVCATGNEAAQRSTRSPQEGVGAIDCEAEEEGQGAQARASLSS